MSKVRILISNQTADKIKKSTGCSCFFTVTSRRKDALLEFGLTTQAHTTAAVEALQPLSPELAQIVQSASDEHLNTHATV